MQKSCELVLLSSFDYNARPVLCQERFLNFAYFWNMYARPCIVSVLINVSGSGSGSSAGGNQISAWRSLKSIKTIEI